MKKRYLLLLFLMVVVALAFHYRHALTREALQWGANETTREFFEGTVRLRDVRLNRGATLAIGKVTAGLKTRHGSFPLEIEGLVSEDPFTNFLTGKPVRFSFRRFGPAGSNVEGVQGEIKVWANAYGSYELQADVVRLSLDEWAAYDPENLSGSSGEFSGSLRASMSQQGEPGFSLRLVSGKAGGTLQARFFDIFLTFMPAGAQRQIVESLSGIKIVSFTEADLILDQASPEKIKSFFHILVPDYNLNLNLNAEIRIEEGDTFLQLAGLLGLIEVKIE